MDELSESLQHMLNDDEGNEEAARHVARVHRGNIYGPDDRQPAIDNKHGSQINPSREEVLQRLEGQDTHLGAGIKVWSSSVRQQSAPWCFHLRL